MTWSKLLRVLLLALIVAAPLAACGKKGPPTVPEGEQDRYPRTYPAQ
jgi:predicted small lipoprotein YifL